MLQQLINKIKNAVKAVINYFKKEETQTPANETQCIRCWDPMEQELTHINLCDDCTDSIEEITVEDQTIEEIEKFCDMANLHRFGWN